MINHTYRECLGMEPGAGSMLSLPEARIPIVRKIARYMNTIRRLRLVMIKNPLNTVITFPPYHKKMRS